MYSFFKLNSKDFFPLFIVYHAIYLEDLTAIELTEKLAQLFNISPRQISQIFKQGPTGIHVLVSDEVQFLMVLYNPLQKY